MGHNWGRKSMYVFRGRWKIKIPGCMSRRSSRISSHPPGSRKPQCHLKENSILFITTMFSPPLAPSGTLNQPAEPIFVLPEVRLSGGRDNEGERGATEEEEEEPLA